MFPSSISGRGLEGGGCGGASRLPPSHFVAYTTPGVTVVSQLRVINGREKGVTVLEIVLDAAHSGEGSEC